jgi:hypothetical protein
MALSLFREKNMARWIGVRPAHNGTQVSVSGTAVNVTSTLYTVTAGKTLFLTRYYVDITVGTLTGYGTLEVYNGVGVFQYYIDMLKALAGGWQHQALSLTFPIEIPAGSTIRMTATGNNGIEHAGITGWEE